MNFNEIVARLNSTSISSIAGRTFQESDIIDLGVRFFWFTDGSKFSDSFDSSHFIVAEKIHFTKFLTLSSASYTQSYAKIDFFGYPVFAIGSETEVVDFSPFTLNDQIANDLTADGDVSVFVECRLYKFNQ